VARNPRLRTQGRLALAVNADLTLVLLRIVAMRGTPTMATSPFQWRPFAPCAAADRGAARDRGIRRRACAHPSRDNADAGDPIVGSGGLVRTKSDQIDAIQVLRAVAAIAVTVAHTYTPLAGTAAKLHIPSPVPTMVTGAAGVDLFFVISGFIMGCTMRHEFGLPGAPLLFFVRRLARIAPLYWLATVCLMLYWIPIGTSMQQESVDGLTVVTSFLLIFHVQPNGSWTPILGQGWTLNYEMYFYALFSAALFFRRRAALVTLLGLLIAAGWSGPMLSTAVPFGIRFAMNGLLWEFAFGVFIALLYTEGLHLPRWGTITMIIAGIGLIFSTTFGREYSELGNLIAMQFNLRAIHWGGPCALIVAGAVFLRPIGTTSLPWRAAVFVGNLSYSLYLFHGLLMMAFERELEPVGAHILLLLGPFGYVIALTICTIAMAAVIFLLIEKPLTNTLSGLIKTHPFLAWRQLSPSKPIDEVLAPIGLRSAGPSTHSPKFAYDRRSMFSQTSESHRLLTDP
jgi:exopolysaccharide production protein ExoZ